METTTEGRRTSAQDGREPAPGRRPGIFQRMVTELISLVTGWLVWMLGVSGFAMFMLLTGQGDRSVAALVGMPWPVRIAVAAACMAFVVPAAVRSAEQLHHSRAAHLLGETLRPPPTPDGRPW